VPAQAGVEHLAQRVAVVHRHELGAKRVVRRVERERKPNRRALLGHPLDPGDPADRRDADVRVRDADVREALAGGEDVVEVHERLAHAHEDGVVQRLLSPEVERLIQDLRRGQVAAEAHRAGRAERAGQRAARLTRHAQRAAAIAVTHQHGLDRAAVVRLEEPLLGAVRGERLVDVAKRREGDLPGEPLAQVAWEVRHLVVRARPAGRPLPHLARAEAGLRSRLEPCVKEAKIHPQKFGGMGLR
jgi:hypothetical protein